MTFVIVVTSLRVYAAKILSKHYYIFFQAGKAALAPPPLWPVGAHPHRPSGTFGFTVCENSLLLNTTFLTSHIGEPVLAHLKPPHPSEATLMVPSPAKAWPSRAGRGHLAADATHLCLQPNTGLSP